MDPSTITKLSQFQTNTKLSPFYSGARRGLEYPFSRREFTVGS